MRDKRGGSRIKKAGFLPGLNMNWNGILEFPTFIWCNNKDNTKTNRLFDIFFPQWKSSPKDEI